MGIRDWKGSGATSFTSWRGSRVVLPLLALRIDDDAAIDAVRVAGVAAEELRRVVLRPGHDEAIIAAPAPALVLGVPLHAAAGVAGEERLVVADPDLGPREHGEPAGAAGGVRNDGTSLQERHDHVARVAEHVRRLRVRGEIAELEARRGREHRGELAFDADVLVDVERHRRAEAVVAEA